MDEALLAYLKSFTVTSDTGCWLWQRKKNGKAGYGIVWSKEKKRRELAHRSAWEAVNGPIAKGLVICHRCDTPACINPDHLFPGTHAENMDDASNKGRMPGRRHPSPYNHRLTVEQVADVKRWLNEGVAVREITRRMPVTMTAIRKIKEGRTYRYV